MNWATLAEVFSAGAGWTAILVTILLFLHGRRLKMLTALERKFDGLKKEMIDMAMTNRAEHNVQAKQIQDIALTIANNYVREPQLEVYLRPIREELAETRKELGFFHNRIDQVLMLLRRGSAD